MHCFTFVAGTCLRRRAAIGVASAALWITWPAAGQPALSLDEALAIAVRDSPLLAAQRSALVAAEEGTYTARELPDPKLRMGVDNLPIEGGDKWSLTRDFMTMRRIGVSQAFIRGEKRELKGRRAEHRLAREQSMLDDTRADLRRGRGPSKGRIGLKR